MQNFSESVMMALQGAIGNAKEKNQVEVSENHLLFALLSEEGGYFRVVLKELGLDPSSLHREVEKVIKHLPTFTGQGGAKISGALSAILQEGESLCKKWNDTYISSDHLLLAFWKKADQPFKGWREKSKISEAKLEETIFLLRGDRHMDSATSEQNVKILDKF